MLFSLENIDDIDVSIYLFGSFIYKEQANDIDILILYDSGKLKRNYQLIFSIKNKVGTFLQFQYNLPIHFTTLSYNELNECSSIKIGEYILLF
ncbi:nucleotidyltransferase domain-containing protein [Anaerosporobacter mobilis]|uniref:nucleotidyltransferase domain-containing protein n=1 Tax=Anaerosporobacter mobilis TaxID=264463 RepID=UPI0038BB4155